MAGRLGLDGVSVSYASVFWVLGFKFCWMPARRLFACGEIELGFVSLMVG